MLSFCLWVTVFPFLGTVYPLQIRQKMAKVCSNENPCAANSSEVAAIFFKFMTASFYTRLQKYLSMQRQKKLYKGGRLLNMVFNIQFVSHKLLIFTSFYTEIYSHTNEWNDYLCLEVCYGQKKMVRIEAGWYKKYQRKGSFVFS